MADPCRRVGSGDAQDATPAVEQSPGYRRIAPTDTWTPAMEWLGQLMAFVRNKPFDADEPDAAQTAKANIARYRGAACGAKYAEALWAMNAQAVEIL